ncbi:MAG: hypothetical protein ACLP9S_04690 [Syntrophales bacterium]
MRGVRAAIGFSILLFLVGCVGQHQQLQPIDMSAIGAIQTEIKRQIGIYMVASHKDPTVKINSIDKKIKELPSDAFWCGLGKIDFDISSIKAELTTTLDSTSGFKVGVTIPISGGTVTPSAGQTHETMDTQVLDYNLWPLPLEDQRSELTSYYKNRDIDKDVSGAPIALVLLDLRSALIQSAMKYDYSTTPPKQKSPQPCFTDYNPDKPAGDAGNLFKIGLTITNDSTGGISINVAPLSIGATGEAKSTTGNTLSVSFIQRGVQDIQKLKDAVDAECKYPKESLPGCTKAKKALKEAMLKTGGGLMLER